MKKSDRFIAINNAAHKCTVLANVMNPWDFTSSDLIDMQREYRIVFSMGPLAIVGEAINIRHAFGRWERSGSYENDREMTICRTAYEEAMDAIVFLKHTLFPA